MNAVFVGFNFHVALFICIFVFICSLSFKIPTEANNYC